MLFLRLIKLDLQKMEMVRVANNIGIKKKFKSYHSSLQHACNNSARVGAFVMHIPGKNCYQDFIKIL